MDTETNSNQTPEVAPQPSSPPVSTEPTMPAAGTPIEPAKKGRSPKILVGGIIAAILVILGAGAVFGYSMWYQNPDKVVHDAMMNLIQAKSMSMTGTATFKSDEITMDITLDSKSSETNGEFNVDAKVAIDSGDMKQEFNAKGAGRMVDETLYVKVSGIRDLVEDVTAQSEGQIPAYASSIFDKIDDKWISIAPSDYQDIDESISKQQVCLTDLMKKAQSDKAMTREITDLYKKNQIITIKEQLGSKEVAGVSSLGYKVGFDTVKAASFTTGLADTSFGKELKECSDDIDFKEMADSFNEEAADNSAEVSTELWVSTFGHTVTAFNVRGSDAGNTVDIAILPTFNTNVAVEAPADATSLKTVLEEIQQAIMESYSELYSDDMMMSESMLSEFEFESEV